MQSTLHYDTKIHPGKDKKPDIIITYNETKDGVDMADQKHKHFSCKRKTRRWPIAIFSNMIDIRALNAFIIFIAIHSDEFGISTKYEEEIPH